jgi:hypothetical protein
MPPKIALVSGHPRSGTTLLAWLLSQDPRITVTNEHRAFMRLGASRNGYLARLRVDDHFRRPLLPLRRGVRLFGPFASWWYAQRFRRLVEQGAPGKVTFEELAAYYARLFPEHKLVGDKFPQYVFHLESLLSPPELVGLVIYRDPRDVTVSALRMVAGAWKEEPFARRMSSPAKIASRWVEAMRNIEVSGRRVIPVQYEALVADPGRALQELADRLGLGPILVSANKVSMSSVGRYRHELTRAQIEEVETIAGPTMVRYGYQLGLA